MKKLIFLFAMVFAVSMAMAQKTTWITQSGTNNVANVDQEACISGDATFIYATQSGSFNALNTEQNGHNNYIELVQSGPSNVAMMEQYTCDAIAEPGGKNTAIITQSGNGNTANLLQDEADVNGWDYGDNKATATQSGNNNSYVLDQGLGSNGWQPNNESYLTQSGNANGADIDQRGYTNYSEIRQFGDGNVTNLDQNDAAMNSPAIWDRSYSWQLGGIGNSLIVYQHGNPGLQYAESTQNGTNNTTSISQLSWNVQQVVSQQLGTDILNVLQTN